MVHLKNTAHYRMRVAERMDEKSYEQINHEGEGVGALAEETD